MHHRSTSASTPASTSTFSFLLPFIQLFSLGYQGVGWTHHLLGNGFEIRIQIIRLCFSAEAFLSLLEEVKDLSWPLDRLPNVSSMIALLDGSIISEIDAFFEWYLHSGWHNPFIPYWIIRRKIASLERGIQEARDLLLSMQAQMQLALRGRAFGAQRWSSPDSESGAQQTRLRVGADSLPSQAHDGVFHSPHAHLDIHARIVHLTQIINTGSGTVSGCSLSSTST